MVIKRRQLLIFLAFAIITFSNAQFLINTGLDDLVAYLGYLLLLLDIVTEYLKLPKSYQRYINRNVFCALFVFCIGIVMQSMGIGLKIRLLITMVIVAMTALASDGVMKSIEDIRWGAYGLLGGVFLVFILSVFTGTNMSSRIDEGMVAQVGFNAGMSHKNYFSMVLFASFSGIYIYYQYNKKKLIDIFLMFVEIFLIFLAHSRAIWILTVIFIFLISLDQIKKITVKQANDFKILIIPIAIILFIIFIRWIYIHYLAYSMTYMARVNGLKNWFLFVNGDLFQLLFGNAAIFFGSSEDYYTHFRNITGTSGAVDMAFLNILIKGGFVGCLGYVLIFGRVIRQALKTDIIKYRRCLIAIVIPMIISAFSENCVGTISIAYAPFCYCVLASLYKQCADESMYKKI